MNAIKAITAIPGVLGKEKSFRRNPILGSERFNRWGLHRFRVNLAANLATSRRKRLAHLIDGDDLRFFEENGYFIRENFLSDEDFATVKRELFDTPHQAHEMHQGQTITRRMTPDGSESRVAKSIFRNRKIRDFMSYAAGRSGEPVISIQAIIANPAIKTADPQTDMHADTFHSTAKMWLFLTDVEEDDGPFVYVPGSNKLTPERLDWEFQQSLTAAKDARLHHSAGSFRLREEELPSLGYGPPKRMTVKANTLVVADTFGFHHRSPSDRLTKRVELYGYLRRNPFLPWNGLDMMSLPGLKGHLPDLYFQYLKARKKYLGKQHGWKDVGKILIDS
ncbi:MAG: phytanoyl-CoA dioxygenase family protein [Pseudomonadota bacterium]